MPGLDRGRPRLGSSWRSIRHAHSAPGRKVDIVSLRGVLCASRPLSVAFAEHAWRSLSDDPVWRRQERTRVSSRPITPSPETTACRGVAAVVASEMRLPQGRGAAHARNPPRNACRVQALLQDPDHGGRSAPFLGLLLWPLGVFPHGRGRLFSSLYGRACGLQNNETSDLVARGGVTVAMGSRAQGRVSHFRVRDRIACFANMVRSHDVFFARRR